MREDTDMRQSGIELSEAYHQDVIAPIVAASWPTMPYAAARLGSGSDVLGLDDAMSADHDWGLRLTVLVPREMTDEVRARLEATVPETYAGHPTRIPLTWHPEPALAVEVSDAADFAQSRLGVDVDHEWTTDDWLGVTGQAVLELTAGPVFVDTDGTLTGIRERLRWYPDDVWRWVIAADWARIGEELPFMARAGDRGDELGSRLIAARICHAIMHLAFLLERRWAPYAKWFGSVFATFPEFRAVADLLEVALSASRSSDRQLAIASALEALAAIQGSRGLPTRSPVVEPFFDRPYVTLGPIADDVVATIADPALRARTPLVGSAEQWSDNVLGLTSEHWRSR